MKYVKLFEEFINEDSVKAGQESDVVIKDLIAQDGTEIASEEILGLVVSSESEEEMVEKLYDKYGNTTFSEEDMSQLKAYWNEYSAEQKEKEMEAEKEAEEEAGEEDPLADMDV